MTKDELIKFHKDTCDKIHATLIAKNNDYAGSEKSESDVFKNFTMSEKFGICTTEQGMLVRLTDKLSRICTFVAGDQLQVKNESVEDTLDDMANYAILLKAYIHSKK